ncbi:uncharacterized protein LOC111885068 [Lactuca sativa]|uniref:uncharacterized protein LOC111885068 n=1 Tax=Lactuca sativa TaxID=4236 RepID=UPI000CD939CE|nr:uncharacterized protein LOC111885068 [Lactuca sativa]
MFRSIKTTLIDTFDDRYAAVIEADVVTATATVAAARPQGGGSLLFWEFSNTKPRDFDGIQDLIAAMRWISDIKGSAVAQPRFDVFGNEISSRKIGIFPLTSREPAKPSTKNHVAGTLETKPILAVTKEIMRSWLIEKVLPAIKAKWPPNHTGPIFIQQDNAKPHIDVNDSEFIEASSQDGFDIRLCFQSPNSPDLNVLDRGFFWAIQSLQEQEVLHMVDELVSAVQTSFDKMQSQELNNVFLTLQTCMKEILKVHGGNNYRIPRIGKSRLERQGNLPLQIECEKSLIDEAASYLI